MSRQLFWKMCLIFAAGVVILFYLLSEVTNRAEEGMSMLAIEDRQTITNWGRQAERLYKSGDIEGLNNFLRDLKSQENTWLAVVSFDYSEVAGDSVSQVYQGEQTLGRSVDWKIHLYFAHNPVMEVSFEDVRASFLIQLPDRMRPGELWLYAKFSLQLIIPAMLMALLCFYMYRHIMKPLAQLQTATRHFSLGNFDVRAENIMGKRNDEFSELAKTFDQMAGRIGEQIISQRQLIADLSHELRTPLTRLDIALSAVKDEERSENLERIERESRHIRKLVEDTLSLAWLDNEKPKLQQESLDLIDLLDVLIDDAEFEYPDRTIIKRLPDSAFVKNSSHRAAGQSIENILRNALRYTPNGKSVEVTVNTFSLHYEILIEDQGPGVPDDLLTAIFKPFFRVDKSREREGNSFGLGLALAQRQLATIRGSVFAQNNAMGGLSMLISLPKN